MGARPFCRFSILADGIGETANRRCCPTGRRRFLPARPCRWGGASGSRGFFRNVNPARGGLAGIAMAGKGKSFTETFDLRFGHGNGNRTVAPPAGQPNLGQTLPGLLALGDGIGFPNFSFRVEQFEPYRVPILPRVVFGPSHPVDASNLVLLVRNVQLGIQINLVAKVHHNEFPGHAGCRGLFVEEMLLMRHAADTYGDVTSGAPAITCLRSIVLRLQPPGKRTRPFEAKIFRATQACA